MFFWYQSIGVWVHLQATASVQLFDYDYSMEISTVMKRVLIFCEQTVNFRRLNGEIP